MPPRRSPTLTYYKKPPNLRREPSKRSIQGVFPTNASPPRLKKVAMVRGNHAASPHHPLRPSPAAGKLGGRRLIRSTIRPRGLDARNLADHLSRLHPAHAADYRPDSPGLAQVLAPASPFAWANFLLTTPSW